MSAAAGLAATFRTLAGAPGEAARDLLRRALGEEDPRIQEAASGALLARRESEAYEILVGRAHLLVDRVRRQIASESARLAAVYRRLLESSEERTRRNVIELVSLGGDPAMAGLLAKGIEDASAEVRARSVAGLLSLADRTGAGDERRGYVLDALMRVVQGNASTAGPSLLGAALRFDPSFEGSFSRIVEHRGDPRREAVMELLRREGGREVVSLVLRMVRSDRPTLRKEGVELLASRTEPAFLETVALQVRALPARTQERMISECGGIPWGAIDVARMPEALQRVTAEWICLPTVPADTRRVWIDRLLEGGSPEVRAYLLRRAAERSEEELQRIAEGLADDASPAVQRALVAVSEGRAAPFWGRILARLVNAGEEEVRSAARRRSAPAGFDSYLRTFRRLDPATLQRATQALRKIDPTIPERLRREMSEPDPVQRVRALGAVRALGRERDLVDEVLGLLRDGDPAVRATAASVLSQTRTLDAVRGLARALADTDARVRANAVEGIGAVRDPRLAHLLRPFLRSGHPRSLANALEALWEWLDPLERRERVTAMLRGDPRMAVSALWLLGRRGIAGFEGEVASLCGDAGHVGSRARRLAAGPALEAAS